MEIMERLEHSAHAQKAMKLFLEGYNCSQSVVLAFKDELGIDETTLARISSSFGGGMGRLREVCGSVSGMFIVLGLLYGYDNPKAKEEKSEHYKRIQELAEQFRQDNHAIVCRELLGLGQGKEHYQPEERTAEYYKKRPCKNLIGLAASYMEEYIKNHPIDR